MAIGSVYQVVFKQSVYGVRCVNVFHFQETASPSSGTSEEDVASAFESQITTKYANALSQEWSGDCLQVFKLGQGGSPHHQLLALPGARTGHGQGLPANSVIKISFYTENYTRHGRGRCSISGLPQDDESDNAIENTSFGLFKLLAEAIRDDLFGGSGGGQYKSVIMAGPPPEAPTEIVQVVVRPQVYKLRSRTSKMC